MGYITKPSASWVEDYYNNAGHILLIVPYYNHFRELERLPEVPKGAHVDMQIAHIFVRAAIEKHYNLNTFEVEDTMTTYSCKDKSVVHKGKEHRLYCGEELTEEATFLLQVVSGELTLQESLTELLMMIKEG